MAAAHLFNRITHRYSQNATDDVVSNFVDECCNVHRRHTGAHYVMYQKNPEVAEFHNFFFESKSQLTNLKNALEATQRSLERRIQRMEAESRAASEKIDAEKDRYGSVFSAHNRLENANEGAEKGISDAQHLYNLQYLKNFEMIVGLGAMVGLVVKCSRS